MKNREKFERTYNDIHAPEALVWKVMDMSKEKKTKEFKRRNVVKYVVCTLAVVVATFAASNGICYAATGESLVTKIKVTINGEATEQDVNWTKDGDNYNGTVTIPGEDGSETTVILDSETAGDFNVDIITDSEETVNEDGSVTEGSVTLEIKDGENVNSVSIENEEQIEE